jgi:hypothetical protein
MTEDWHTPVPRSFRPSDMQHCDRTAVESARWLAHDPSRLPGCLTVRTRGQAQRYRPRRRLYSGANLARLPDRSGYRPIPVLATATGQRCEPSTSPTMRVVAGRGPTA